MRVLIDLATLVASAVAVGAAGAYLYFIFWVEPMVARISAGM